MEKQAKKKETIEFKNSPEILSRTLSELPNILLYVSEDSLEFDILVTHYKNLFKKNGEQFETITYVPDEEDIGKLFMELFNYSMFASWKLILIREGNDFFKTFTKEGKKDLYTNFKNNINNISEKIYMVVHINSKDLPSKVSTLFNNKYGILKNRNFYNDERKRALDDICKSEKIFLDPEAIEEFIHRVPPNTGSYFRSITKLKNLLHKKHFTTDEVVEILFPSSEFNPFQLTDIIFSGNRQEFYKEFEKLARDDSQTRSILSLLNSLLGRIDEVRKAKLLFRRFPDSDSDIFKYLGMSSYSEGRKRHIKVRLKKEVALFSDKALDFFYEFLIQMSIREKSSNMKTQDSAGIYFQNNIEKLFQILKKES